MARTIIMAGGWTASLRAAATSVNDNHLMAGHRKGNDGMTGRTPKVVVLGGGSWGTTLALLAERAGHDPWLWIRNSEVANEVHRSRRNDRALAGIAIPKAVTITSNLSHACREANVILVATASVGVRSVGAAIAGDVGNAIVVSCAKGFERDTLKRMTEVLKEELPLRAAASTCALSGPNLSLELAEGKPSTTVIASEDLDAAQQVQDLLISTQFRPYTNEDVIGVEMAGALKNIIAIGAGIADGMGAGDNAKAAFMTRGLAEIARLGVATGANPLTFAGLAGLGDLVATCASTLSRNHFVGEQLALGKALDQIQATMTHVAEGIFTTAAAKQLAQQFGIEMPITEQLYSVLYEGKSALSAIAELMQRESKHETKGIYGVG
jgi:glycerol-3-phosphate dehydrogenase (NAD(P)+)